MEKKMVEIKELIMKVYLVNNYKTHNSFLFVFTYFSFNNIPSILKNSRDDSSNDRFLSNDEDLESDINFVRSDNICCTFTSLFDNGLLPAATCLCTWFDSDT